MFYAHCVDIDYLGVEGGLVVFWSFSLAIYCGALIGIWFSLGLSWLGNRWSSCHRCLNDPTTTRGGDVCGAP
jgi:hypothetical protein